MEKIIQNIMKYFTKRLNPTTIKVINLSKLIDKDLIIILNKEIDNEFMSKDFLNYIAEFFPFIYSKIAEYLNIEVKYLKTKKVTIYLLLSAISELKENKESYFGYSY